MAKTIMLKDIPKQVQKAIAKQQSDHYDIFDIKLNQSQAVIKMLKDYIRCKEENNFKPSAE
jgi:hypothetical protein